LFRRGGEPTVEAMKAYSVRIRGVPEILPLRTRHAAGPVILVDGVRAGHRATDVLSQAA